MTGYLALILHAHLPFVRHPEHAKALEESWLFEAITEAYLPLLQRLEAWRREGLGFPLALSLSPTLCAMLVDPLLRQRFVGYLDGLEHLAHQELARTVLNRPLHGLAQMYWDRFASLRQTYLACDGNLVAAFAGFQQSGQLEIIPCAATHAVLPLLAHHRPSLRAQVLVARDFYRDCFGANPSGFWLPECAYCPAVEDALQEAGVQWFILDTHGILHAKPRPRYGILAPIVTPHGLAAFGREPVSARQIWSRAEGYPGAAAYRDFYRDAGFDLDLEYVRPFLPCPGHRGFTGFKYFAITGHRAEKKLYDRSAALRQVADHAAQFIAARSEQVKAAAAAMEIPPLVVLPFDAELFGHWWFEGPEFLDQLARLLAKPSSNVQAITPKTYLQRHPSHQVASPSASSWGEGGFAGVWLNEKSAWIYPQLQAAQHRMSALARAYPSAAPAARHLLELAAQELLLAQASDWPFMLRSGTSPLYAQQQVVSHLQRFNSLYDQLLSGPVDRSSLTTIETQHKIFPHLDCRYWGSG